MARMLVLVLLFFALLAAIFFLPYLFPHKPPAAKDASGGPNAPEGNRTSNAPQPPAIALPPILPGEKPAPQPAYDIGAMEQDIHSLVNAERIKAGLAPLAYNDEVASVAQGHSDSLAKENANLTDPFIYCPDVFIHHEGFASGLYQDGRLANASIYYFNASGENIFMVPEWSYKYASIPYPPCDRGSEVVEEYDNPADVLSELRQREDYARSATRVNWTRIDWVGQADLEEKIVRGWMSSPGHRANILEAGFGEEGIGIAQVNEFVIVTEVFIERTDCGFPGAGCCVEGDYGYCWEPWACDGSDCS